MKKGIIGTILGIVTFGILSGANAQDKDTTKFDSHGRRAPVPISTQFPIEDTKFDVNKYTDSLNQEYDKRMAKENEERAQRDSLDREKKDPRGIGTRYSGLTPKLAFNSPEAKKIFLNAFYAEYIETLGPKYAKAMSIADEKRVRNEIERQINVNKGEKDIFLIGSILQDQVCNKSVKLDQNFFKHIGDSNGIDVSHIHFNI